MEKEDRKVLIHVGLAFVVILGGFALMELYGGSRITAQVVGSDKIHTVNCINVNNMVYQGIENKDDCCKLINQADKCELLAGKMDIEYNNENYQANYICYLDAVKLYFSFDMNEYCELLGYKIILE
jgi:hypothetical protein